MARKNPDSKAPDAFANLSFGEAKDRLQAILEDLEGHEVDIDDLADQVKEAAALIRVLNDKLTRTEIEVKKVVSELRPAGPGTAAGSDGSEEGASRETTSEDAAFSDEPPF